MTRLADLTDLTDLTDSIDSVSFRHRRKAEMSRRLAAAAQDARAMCACGRKAELEDFPYG